MAYGLKPRIGSTSRSHGALRWAAVLGFAVGCLAALVVSAPASWAGAMLDAATGGRLALIHPTGTVWRGQATLALGAGPGSRGQLALPQRLAWRISPTFSTSGLPAFRLRFEQPAVLSQPIEWMLQPGWSASSLSLRSHADGSPVTVQFPAAFLAGLGAPWNTLQPSGRLVFQFDRLQWTAGYQAPPAIEIGLKIQMLNIASRVATLPVLGHYELDVRGGPGELALKLDSRPGSALRLEGQGRWRPGGRVEFRGEASASAGREEALSNLLNIIGRRDGPRSVMAIGAPSGAAPPSARTP